MPRMPSVPKSRGIVRGSARGTATATGSAARGTVIVTVTLGGLTARSVIPAGSVVLRPSSCGTRAEAVDVGRHHEGVAPQACQGRGRAAERHEDLVGREGVASDPPGARQDDAHAERPCRLGRLDCGRDSDRRDAQDIDPVRQHEADGAGHVGPGAADRERQRIDLDERLEVSASPSSVTVGVSSVIGPSSKPVAGVPVTIALIGSVRLVSWLPTRIGHVHARWLELDLADLDVPDVDRDEVHLLVDLEAARVDPDAGHGRDDLAHGGLGPGDRHLGRVHDRVVDVEARRLDAAVDLDGDGLRALRVEADGDLAGRPVEDLDLRDRASSRSPSRRCRSTRPGSCSRGRSRR